MPSPLRHAAALLAVPLLAVAAPAQSAPVDDLPRRAFFGARIAPLPDSLRARAGAPSAGGVLVERVEPRSSAEAAGIRAGDVLLSVDTATITDPQRFVALVGGRRAGSTVTLRWLRDGRREERRLALSPFPREQAAGWDVLYTSVRVDSARRRVVVTRPRGAGRHPTVLLVGGIGCYSIDTPIGEPGAYQRILNHLTAHGYVTVRVEKSGMGDSEGPPCATVDFRTEVAGYREALRAARGWTFVDSARVAILGHSIGGIVGPVVAAESPPVRGVIAMSTVGTSWIEYELANTRRQLRLGGTPPDSTDALMRVKERCMHALLVERRPPDAVRAADPACAGFMQYPAHHAYMTQLAALDLGAVWRRVDARTLLVYPTSDFLTSAHEHEYLRDAIEAMRPGTATYVAVPGMDHYFAPAASQRASMQAQLGGAPSSFHEEILPVLQRWLDETLKGGVAGR